MRKSKVVRFMEKVTKTESCWLWNGTTQKNGYGQFYDGANTRTKGKNMEGAHRVAYELFVGEIPDKLCVLHKCDVRNCVNPDHLFLGTHKDNTKDMIDKGRRFNIRLAGANNPSAKLTEAQVREIREKRANGVKQKDICKEYGVHRSTILRITSGQTWK